MYLILSFRIITCFLLTSRLHKHLHHRLQDWVDVWWTYVWSNSFALLSDLFIHSYLGLPFPYLISHQLKFSKTHRMFPFPTTKAIFSCGGGFLKKFEDGGQRQNYFPIGTWTCTYIITKKNCGPTIIYNDELAPRTFLIENPIFLYALIRVYFFTLMNRLLHLRNLLREGANLKPSWPTDGATSYNRYNYNVQTDLRATRMNQLPRIAGPSALF